MATTTIGNAILWLKGDNKDLKKKLGEAEKSVVSSMKKMEKSAKALGKVFTVVGAAMTAAFATTVKGATSFQQVMGQIASLGVEDLDALEQRIKDVSIAYGVDLFDSVEQTYQLISGGLKEVQAFDIIESAAKAARAGVGTLGEAMEAGIAVMNSFGLKMDGSAESSAQFADIMGQLSSAVAQGKTTICDMASRIGRIAGLASNAGISSAELTAAIAVLTTTGSKASEQVAGLKAIIAAIQKPSADAATLIRLMGLEFDSVSLRAKGLGPFLKDLTDKVKEQFPVLQEERARLEALLPTLEAGSKAWKGTMKSIEDLTKLGSEWGDVLARLFGSMEAQNAAVNLSTSLSAKLADATKAAAGGVKTLNEMFKENIKNDPSFTFKQLKSQLQVLSVEIGQVLLPVLAKIVESMKPIVQNVLDWMKRNPDLTESIIKWAGGVGALMLVLGPLLIALPTVIRLIKGLVTVLKILALNPVIIVISGIALALSALLEMLITGDFTQNWITRLIDKEFPKLGEALRKVSDWFVQGIARWGEIFRTLGATIGQALSDVWQFITSPFRAAWDWVTNRAIEFIQWIKTLPRKILEIFKGVGENIIAPFRLAFETIDRLFGGLISKMTRRLGQFLGDLKEGLGQILREQGILSNGNNSGQSASAAQGPSGASVSSGLTNTINRFFQAPIPQALAPTGLTGGMTFNVTIPGVVVQDRTQIDDLSVSLARKVQDTLVRTGVFRNG